MSGDRGFDFQSRLCLYSVPETTAAASTFTQSRDASISCSTERAYPGSSKPLVLAGMPGVLMVRILRLWEQHGSGARSARRERYAMEVCGSVSGEEADF
jgi:hypothetical protein